VQTCGLTLDDLQLIDLANAPLVKAGIAGQVNSGVFHIDELAQVEGNTGQKWVLIDTPPEIKEGLHYAMLIASKDAIENNREGLVRFLEGWIRTQQLMSSSDAGDKKAFAEIANKANEAGVDVNMAAIDSYQDINYWVNDDGLNEKQVMSQLDELVNVGSVKADSKPSYDQVVDPSLYAEAKKRVEEKM
jgi:NitT/TauT family transport system substrate-binding protein